MENNNNLSTLNQRNNTTLEQITKIQSIRV